MENGIYKLLKKKQNNLGSLHYEIQMFRCMYEYLKRDNFNKGLSNAILESFLVHVRNLIDFFQGTDNKPPYKHYCDDVIKSDFKDGGGNNLSLVDNWEITRDDKNKINKRLSHITELRTDMDKDWSKERERFKEEIEKAVKQFLEEISNEYFPFEKDGIDIKKENFGKYEKDFCDSTKINNGKINHKNLSSEGISNTSSGCVI